MIIGVILVVVGLVALAYQGVPYTTREKVADLGPVAISTEKKRTIPLRPILGGLALAGGITLLVIGSRKASWALAHDPQIHPGLQSSVGCPVFAPWRGERRRAAEWSGGGGILCPTTSRGNSKAIQVLLSYERKT